MQELQKKNILTGVNRIKNNYQYLVWHYSYEEKSEMKMKLF